MYVNGSSNGPISGNFFNYDIHTISIGGNVIGGTSTNSALMGMIQQVQFYNTSLSGQEILQLYQGIMENSIEFDNCSIFHWFDNYGTYWNFWDCWENRNYGNNWN